MKVLGIDPGTTLVGYALLEEEGQNLRALKYGLIEIKKKDSSEKLTELESHILGLIKNQKIDLAGVEKLFFAKNKKTAISVAQARGVILNTLARSGIKTIEPTPMQIKQSVTGHGLADKGAVAKMVSQILKLKEPVKEDNTADALAIAITTAIRYKQQTMGI